jgi:MFS transporter, ACS family, solute carrier family 17 (sodium-dependent inorganic phosphate cotransporter), other
VSEGLKSACALVAHFKKTDSMSNSSGFTISPKWSGWLPNGDDDDNDERGDISKLREVWRYEAEAEEAQEQRLSASPLSSDDDERRLPIERNRSSLGASINHSARDWGDTESVYINNDDDNDVDVVVGRGIDDDDFEESKKRNDVGNVLLGGSSAMVASPSKTYWRFFIILFCHLALQVAYILRVDTSVAIIPMALEFNFDKTQQGLVLSSFYIGYLIMMLPGGWIVVRFGGKWPLAVSLLLSSLFTALTPVVAARSYGGLIAMRILTGMAEAITYPANHDLLTNWVPAAEQSRAVPFVFSGAFIGTIIALLAAPPLVDASGWESVFYCFSAFSLVWLVPWALFAASTPEKHPFVSAEERIYIRAVTAESGLVVTDSLPQQQLMNAIDEADLFSDARSDDGRRAMPPWRAIFSSTAVWAVCVANFANNWAFYVLLSFMPTYFSSEFSFSLDDSSALSVGPYALMAIAGVASGYIADRLIGGEHASRTITRKLFIVVGFMVPAVLLVTVQFVDETAAIVITTLATGILGCALPGWTPNHLDLSPRYASVLLGLSNTWGTLPGAFGVYLSGWILDETDDDWSVVFGLAAIILGAGTLFFLVFGSGKRQSSLA